MILAVQSRRPARQDVHAFISATQKPRWRPAGRDYTSLRWLHEIVHDVNDRSPLIKDEEGPFLGLAYDIRKAYERQREILPPPPHCEEMGTRYGVQILWPVLLLQQRI